MLASEIKYYIKNRGDQDFGHKGRGRNNHIKGNYVSLIFSCIIYILLSLFLLLTFISWRRNKNTLEIGEDCKTREFYSGMCTAPKRLIRQQKQKKRHKNRQAQEPKETFAPKDIRVARLYYILFLARRMMMALIIVIVPGTMIVLKMSLLFVLQVACIAYAVSFRSFENKKDQAVETFNECIIAILMIFVTKFDSNEKWTDTSSDAFIAVILFQSWILLLVSMGGVILKICGFCK